MLGLIRRRFSTIVLDAIFDFHGLDLLSNKFLISWQGVCGFGECSHLLHGVYVSRTYPINWRSSSVLAVDSAPQCKRGESFLHRLSTVMSVHFWFLVGLWLCHSLLRVIFRLCHSLLTVVKKPAVVCTFAAVVLKEPFFLVGFCQASSSSCWFFRPKRTSSAWC